MREDKLKFNKRLINRIVIVREKNKTWKGKILEVLDPETFKIKNEDTPSAKDKEVDIYSIERVL